MQLSHHDFFSLPQRTCRAQRSYKQIALSNQHSALITKPYKLEGQDIRFLRKFLGLSSEAFAALLDVDKSHLSRVENGATPVSATADRLVRLVALGLAEGLEQKARDVIVNFSRIKQPKKLKVLVDAGTRSVEYKAA